MGIVEQVREGLEAKIEGLETSLRFVRDPREIERIQADLTGARKALAKLNEKDTRTPEELEKIAQMFNHDDATIDAPETPWNKLTPIEKFKYHLDLYCGKIDEAFGSASKQYAELKQIVKFLEATDFKKHPYMESIHKQFRASLRELEFSVNQLRSQIAIKDKALKVVDGSFDSLDVLNRFMNNPMNLPHLSDERDGLLEKLRNENK